MDLARTRGHHAGLASHMERAAPRLLRRAGLGGGRPGARGDDTRVGLAPSERRRQPASPRRRRCSDQNSGGFVTLVRTRGPQTAAALPACPRESGRRWCSAAGWPGRASVPWYRARVAESSRARAAVANSQTRAFGGPGSIPPPLDTQTRTYPAVMMPHVIKTGRYIFMYMAMGSLRDRNRRFGAMVPEAS